MKHIFEILAKNMVFTLCSIFSNSRHVIQDIKNSNINFIANILKNMHAKFQLNPCSSFRGEDFWKSLRTTDDGRRTTDDRRRRTQSDDKSSHCLRQGELKMLLDPYVLFLATAAMYFHGSKIANGHFVQDALRNNHVKFHLILPSSFRGEYFWKKLTTTDDDGRNVMTIAHLLKKNHQNCTKN